MNNDYSDKSSVDEIRARFDADVARFSNLETGQQSTLDAPLCLELITETARQLNPAATQLLDIGCGAGNYTLMMLRKLPGLHCTLVDLSMPMLRKANERVWAQTTGRVTTLQGDIRELPLPEDQYDIILAGAVLHHLREEREWEAVFAKLYKSLRRGGSIWISDLVVHDAAPVQQLLWQKYGAYLESIGGVAFREKVFSYIDKEDSPRSLVFQLDMLQRVGFRQVEVLHKNLCFAAFGAIK